MRILVSVYLFCLSIYSFTANAGSHRPEDFLSKIRGSKNEGAEIYTHFCANCHADKPLIALGAPRYNEDQDWLPRLKQGISTLFKHTDEGYNAMPARGGCFECSDEQLFLAIEVMLPSTLQKSYENKLKEYKKSIK